MLTEILAHLEAGIVRFSNALSRDPGTAEDYAQTARMTLVRKLPQKLAGPIDPDSLILWAGMVAKNAMLQERRRDRKRAHDVSFDDTKDIDPLHFDVDEMVELEFMGRIQRYIHQMSPRTQAIVKELYTPSERTRAIWMEVHSEQTQAKQRGKIARTINFHAVPGFVIAKSLNVSPATVSRSMSEIRQVLAEAGIGDPVETK